MYYVYVYKKQRTHDLYNYKGTPMTLKFVKYTRRPSSLLIDDDRKYVCLSGHRIGRRDRRNFIR